MALADFKGAIQWYDTADKIFEGHLKRSGLQMTSGKTWEELSIRSRCYCELEQFSKAVEVLKELSKSRRTFVQNLDPEHRSTKERAWRAHIRSDLKLLGRAYEGLGQDGKAEECHREFEELGDHAEAADMLKATVAGIELELARKRLSMAKAMHSRLGLHSSAVYVVPDVQDKIMQLLLKAMAQCNICRDEKLKCDIVDVGGEPYVGPCCLVCFRLNEEYKRAALKSDSDTAPTAPTCLDWNPIAPQLQGKMGLEARMEELAVDPEERKKS